MNNFEILEMVNELKTTNLIGVFMRDEIKNIKLPGSDFYFIYNFQTSTEDGSHWLVAGRKDNENFHFCPYGSDPCIEVIDLLGKPIITSTFRIQEYTEKCCGLYCILLIYLLSQGNSFEDSILSLNATKSR